MKGTKIASGLALPEGPFPRRDGTLIFVQIARGEVSELRDGQVGRVAYVGGAPHAVIEGADGSLYVTQSGAVTVGSHVTADPRPSGIQVVRPDGSIEYLVTEVDGRPLVAPNDLCFGPDQRLYFTDPGGSFEPGATHQRARICAIDRTGAGETVFEAGSVFTNGIAFDGSGILHWTESYMRTVCRLDDRRREVVASFPEGNFTDGLKCDAAGQITVAITAGGGLAVLARDGSEVGWLECDRFVTNVHIDGEATYATDFGDFEGGWDGSGSLWRFSTGGSRAITYPGWS